MQIITKFFYISLILIYSSCSTFFKSEPPIKMYQNARDSYSNQNFEEAKSKLELFISENKGVQDTLVRERVLWSIDLLCRIYITKDKAPETTISFLQDISNTMKLVKSEKQILSEWITVLKTWKSSEFFNPSKEADFFNAGEEYYTEGMEKISYPKDYIGNMDFYISSYYLNHYIYKLKSEKNAGKALFMLGNIRYRSWNDSEYWTENHYLEEVIRKFPHSDLSKKAYKLYKKGKKHNALQDKESSDSDTKDALLIELKKLSQ